MRYFELVRDENVMSIRRSVDLDNALRETAQNDAEAHALANAVIDAVIKAVQWRFVPEVSPLALRFTEPNTDFTGRYWVIDGGMIEDSPIDLSSLMILIGAKDSNIVKAGHTPGKILLRCLPNMENSDQIISMLRRPGKARQAFLHELIHYFDHLRQIPSPSQPKNNIEYFNSPTEFNAYYHNVAAPLFDLLAKSQIDPHAAQTIARKLGVQKDFHTVLKNLLRPSHAGPKAFIKILNTRNRRALIRRLYNLFNEVVAALEEPNQVSR